MFKSSKFFRIILIGIALVIFNQCELKAQQAFISADEPYYADMTWDGSQFTYTGYIVGQVFFGNGVQGTDGEGYVTSFPSGIITPSYQNAISVVAGYYVVTFNLSSGAYTFGNATSCYGSSNTPILSIYDNTDGFYTFCNSAELYVDHIVNGENMGLWYPGLEYQWLVNGQPIDGENEFSLYPFYPSAAQDEVISLIATCPINDDTLYSNEVIIPACYIDFTSSLNYVLVENVSTTGNVAGQSIQVQFDLNWGNTWKDDVNWDAVWIFMKYKDSQGFWQNAKVSQTGFANGEGTFNIIEPTADQAGAFVRLGINGRGHFTADAMQLRWNYGADGLSSVAGLEVRVYAIEMVYVPQGDFSMSAGATAPGNKIPVINARLSPVLSADNDANIRIKGDAGLDVDANGTVDNTSYPSGYYPFYTFKYEMSEQQYADFLNCLTPAQRTTLGVAGSTITQSAGQYFASSPNQVCAGANADRLLAYADWCGLRPLSYLEFQKSHNGPKAPGANSQTYGVKNMGSSLAEPYIRISSSAFNRTNHGNGVLSTTGLSNEPSWIASEVGWLSGSGNGFRLCRTAE